MIFLKSGNVPLNLAFDDDINQEANSTYQLSFKFPVIDETWHLLTRETLLVADDLHGEQEFIIIEAIKQHGFVQIYANQVTTLLNHYSISSIDVDRVNGPAVMNALAGSIKRDNPFSFTSDIQSNHTFRRSDVSVMVALCKDAHSIIGQWGGDLVRDKYQIKLLKSGGKQSEALFMYKKNMSSYKETGNIKGLKTRIHFKKVIRGQNGSEDRVLTLTMDSPLISSYQQIYEANVEINDQDVVDSASLTDYARNYFSQTLCDVVEESIEINVKGYAEGSVQMFDTVSVFHERFNTDLRLKISKYRFSPMSKELKSVGFGKVSRSLGEAVSSMVNSAVNNARSGMMSDIEVRIEKEIANANKAFDAEFDKRLDELDNSVEKAKAKAEETAAEISKKLKEDNDKAQEEIIKRLKSVDLSGSKDFEEIRQQLSLHDQILGSDGKVRYNKNLVDGNHNQTKRFEETELTVNVAGGIKKGQTYTISFEALCQLLEKTKATFRQPNAKPLTLTLRSNLPHLKPIELEMSVDEFLADVVPYGYELAITSDWYQSKSIQIDIRNQQVFDLGLAYREVADGDKLIGEWAEVPEIIFDGGKS